MQVLVQHSQGSIKLQVSTSFQCQNGGGLGNHINNPCTNIGIRFMLSDIRGSGEGDMVLTKINGLKRSVVNIFIIIGEKQ